MGWKFLSILLLVCFASREVAATFREPPEPRFIQVTAEQMNSLTRDPSVRVKQVLLTQEEVIHPQATAHKRIKEGEEVDDFQDFVNKDSHYGGSGVSTWVNFSGGDGPIIVFAIVGLVLVIAWIAAFPYTLYMATTNKKKYQNLQLLNVNYSFMESARLVGTRYSLYLANKETSLMGNSMGFSGELGYYDYYRYGQYWMIGPSFIDGFELGNQYAFVKLDLMAGSTFNSSFGLVSKSEVSLNVEVSSKLSLGLGMGALYLESNGYRGAAFANDHKWGFLYGVNASYLF